MSAMALSLRLWAGLATSERMARDFERSQSVHSTSLYRPNWVAPALNHHGEFNKCSREERPDCT
jgi:hypothetical protein